MRFNTIEEAIIRIQQGEIIIMVDDENRENEGDLIVAAEKVTPEIVNFMAKHGRGMICAPLTEGLAEKYALDLMVEETSDPMNTAFTITVDHLESTTGISAFERAKTIKALAAQDSRQETFRRPGHVFPLIAKPGGVLKRAGHTEATVDLMRLAGLEPVGSICEIMNEDGTMARVPELMRFAEKYNLAIITIADLIKYKLGHERLVKQIAETKLPTEYGEFKMIVYEDLLTGKEHLALVKGERKNFSQAILTRVHSECLTGDVFHSLRCDCGEQLGQALKLIEKAGEGILLYLRQEGRGIGLANKIRAYQLQDMGKDTVEANEILGFPADLRDYGIGAQILVDLGAKKLRLLTNNPKKVIGLAGYGLEIVERLPLEVKAHKENIRYMQTKKDKLGHLLTRL